MASPHAVPIIRELGIRESCASGTLAVFSTADHATPYPSSFAKARHHETNRLAYFSAHLFDAASIYWCGTEDHAGTTASFDNSCDARYLHAGSDNGKAKRAGGSCRALVPRKNARNASSVWLNTITCTYFVPFVPTRKWSTSGKWLKRMAGTTRLELATSAV